ncbi:MAG: hypothetical protein FWF60_02255 [Oscillospiraceae bacterium]|nr:hypothetical protein [Oscillospiraceae bacterium]MCL1951629.1 hypothetical protein [Oscillospiraceae bacterium]
MEKFIVDQALATVKYVPFHLAASYAKKRSSPEVERSRARAGGFIKGICHPTENYEQIKGAGIEWNRADIPFPFDKEGKVKQDYLDWKAKMRRYRENGIRIFAVTPYPSQFLENGIDPREDEARVREVAAFLATDLRDIAEAFQVTNEMGVPRFTLPLTMDEAIRFIGIQLAAMHPLRGNALLGYNSAGPQADLHPKLRPWHKYCDYVGIDIYIGCFAPVANWMYLHEGVLRYLWSLTGKPVILTEFGYISGGAPKTPEEKSAVLQRYGVRSEQEARENLDAFMERIKEVSPKIWEYTTKNASGNYADFLFQLDFCNHFYSELPAKTVIKKYPHTPDGQAGFYSEIFPRLAKLPFLLGAFVYCWKDSEKCYVCGQSDCPTETRWGLVDMRDNEKPAYYAVRDALAKIK